MKKFIYFKDAEEFDVWINIDSIATLVMRDCEDNKVSIAWTNHDGSGESCKIYKTTADKIKKTLNIMTFFS